MDIHTQPRDIIEIKDESDDDQDVRLEDFMTTEELNAILKAPSAPMIDSDQEESNGVNNISRKAVPSPKTMPTYEQCLQEILQVFPDISHKHVRNLYESPHVAGVVTPGFPGPESLIPLILDGGQYPKERDRLNELKRKRLSELNSDDERALTWKNAERIAGESFYSIQARNLLQEDFLDIPRRFIDLKFKESGNLYATYLALGLAEATYESTTPTPYTKLKVRRRASVTDIPTYDEMSLFGNAFRKLKEELGAARAQQKKLQTQRQIKKDVDDAEAAEEKRLRDSGQVMECACCFDDVTINKITFCSADEPHAFCFECAATNANTQIGLSRYVLGCMDGSGCKALFSRQERERFLDAKIIEKLDRLQQQTELREADLPNLETCPFCDFAAICPPIEVDKEFPCGNPECEKVSCRKCRNITHIPLSCAEFKKENGVSERHQIEEARTQAVLRTCPKCKSAIFKDGGCNKIMCSCGGAVCDYCGKDITKEKYQHFRDGPTAVNIPGMRGKCPTHDNDYVRNQQNMEKAEKDAMEKIRKENPDLSEDDLRIKFRENVKTPPRDTRYHIPGAMQANAMVYNQGPVYGLHIPPWMANPPRPPAPYQRVPAPQARQPPAPPVHLPPLPPIHHFPPYQARYALDHDPRAPLRGHPYHGVDGGYAHPNNPPPPLPPRRDPHPHPGAGFEGLKGDGAGLPPEPRRRRRTYDEDGGRRGY